MRIKGLMAFVLAAAVTLTGIPLNIVKAAEGVPIDDTSFPDEIFREFVSENFDWDMDGVLTEDEMYNVSVISVGKRGIGDLTGIEYFSELTSLNCMENKLTFLDLSGNTALKELYCDKNMLTGLSLSKNTELNTLSCSYNQLTALDLGNNTNLQKLWCENNALTSLDISGNTGLWALYCSSNLLTGLDVSRNKELSVLQCKDNKLTALNVSNNKYLTSLYALGNDLTQVDVSVVSNYLTLEHDAPEMDRERGVLIYSEGPAPDPEPVIVNKTIKISKKATLKAKKKVFDYEIADDTIIDVIKKKGKKVTIIGLDEGITTISVYDKKRNFIRDWVIQVK